MGSRIKHTRTHTHTHMMTSHDCIFLTPLPTCADCRTTDTHHTTVLLFVSRNKLQILALFSHKLSAQTHAHTRRSRCPRKGHYAATLIGVACSDTRSISAPWRQVEHSHFKCTSLIHAHTHKVTHTLKDKNTLGGKEKKITKGEKGEIYFSFLKWQKVKTVDWPYPLQV